MSNSRPSKGKPRKQIIDVVEVGSTNPGSEPVSNESVTYKAPNLVPVPEQRTTLDAVKEFFEKYGIVVTALGSIAVISSAFLIFRNDLSKAQEDIALHSSKFESEGAARVKIDKRVVRLEQEVGFADRRLSSVEGELKDVGAQVKSIEKDQAVINDRVERSRVPGGG